MLGVHVLLERVHDAPSRLTCDAAMHKLTSVVRSYFNPHQNDGGLRLPRHIEHGANFNHLKQLDIERLQELPEGTGSCLVIVDE